jgi:hypothetical protein
VAVRAWSRPLVPAWPRRTAPVWPPEATAWPRGAGPGRVWRVRGATGPRPVAVGTRWARLASREARTRAPGLPRMAWMPVRTPGWMPIGCPREPPGPRARVCDLPGGRRGGGTSTAAPDRKLPPRTPPVSGQAAWVPVRWRRVRAALAGRPPDWAVGPDRAFPAPVGVAPGSRLAGWRPPTRLPPGARSRALAADLVVARWPLRHRRHPAPAGSPTGVGALRAGHARTGAARRGPPRAGRPAR